MALRSRLKRKLKTTTKKSVATRKKVAAKKKTSTIKKSRNTQPGGRAMPTRRQHDHIGNYNFMVEIEGVMVGAFSQVSGLESVTDVITYYDGNDRIVRKRPGRTKYSNIILFRGFTNNDDLWQWRRSVTEGAVERKSGSIILLDEARNEITRYNFFEAWPARWKSMVLDASDNDVVIEELEIVVEKIEKA